jgi:hypothetical protein
MMPNDILMNGANATSDALCAKAWTQKNHLIYLPTTGNF